MSELKFENVTAEPVANIYFEGKVVSHTIRFQDGSRKTMGVIFPGSYNFGTAEKERMDVTAGTCRVKLAGESEFKSYETGTAFFIEANSSFDVEVSGEPAQYVCNYG